MGHIPPAAHAGGLLTILSSATLTLNLETQLRNNAYQIEVYFCVSHQPWPVDDFIQPQSDEDELKNIH